MPVTYLLACHGCATILVIISLSLFLFTIRQRFLSLSPSPGFSSTTSYLHHFLCSKRTRTAHASVLLLSSWSPLKNMMVRIYAEQGCEVYSVKWWRNESGSSHAIWNASVSSVNWVSNCYLLYSEYWRTVWKTKTTRFWRLWETSGFSWKTQKPDLGKTRLCQPCLVLPPSQNSCPKSQMNRENSGICPKRHRLRILLNESYLSMYNTKYRRHSLNVHFEFCYS